MIRRQGTTFGYDSSNQLVCVEVESVNCYHLSAQYDVDGQRIRASRPLEDQTLYLADLFEYRPSGSWAKAYFKAFGRRFAFKVQSSTATLRTAEQGSFVLPLPAPKALALIGIAAAVLLLLGFAEVSARRGRGVLRPGYAAATAFLVVLIAVPPAAWPGGPPPGGPPIYRRWIFGDQVGSFNVLLTETGVQAERHAFAPFGGFIGGTNNEGSPYVFADRPHEYNLGLGIVYMGARWYDVVSGRFMSIDPLIPNLADPQSHNPYSYARNDPVNRVDPTGEADFRIRISFGSRSGARISMGSGGLRIGGLPSIGVGLPSGGAQGCGFAGCSGSGGLGGYLPPIDGINGVVSPGGMASTGTSAIGGVAATRFGAGDVGAVAGAGAAAVACSATPFCGELADVAVLFDPESALWERGLSAASLAASVLTAGVGPNVGAVLLPLRMGRSSGRTADAATAARTAPDGIVYKRTNPSTGDCYVGQCRSQGRYDARQGEHDRSLDANHEYEVLGRARPGTELDVLEESKIRELGGLQRERGTLMNRRHQMSEPRYRANGGAVDDPRR